MIPKYFEFQSSAKILSGRHALENLPSELKNLGAKKPMILSDEILKKIGTLQIVTDALAAGGIREGAVYTRIPADSSLQVVRNIVKEYKKKGVRQPGGRGRRFRHRYGEGRTHGSFPECGRSAGYLGL